MNADGSGKTRLTSGGASDPAWSPDGTKIAFSAGQSAANHVYVMNADGSNVTQVTSESGLFPSWSSDGTRLAFARYSYSVWNYDVWVVNADGSGEVNITNNPFEDIFPVWQPGGSKIAFQSYRDGNREIYLVNPDGTGLTNITNNPAEEEFPDWSPDGSRIAFNSTRDGYYGDIYTMNADGSGVTRLTQMATIGFNNKYPAWSPDGTKIAFTSNRDFNDEIYVMNADGSGATRLTNNAPPGNTTPEDWRPDWQPLRAADTTAPVLTVPDPISANATSPTGAKVIYTATATDDTDPNPVVSCIPPSGSVFVIGTTTVNCTATDSSGNSASASFTMHVKGAAEQLADLGNAVKGVGPGTSLAVKVGIAEWFVAHGMNRAACMTLTAFNLEVRALSGKKIPPAQATTLIADATRIKTVLGC